MKRSIPYIGILCLLLALGGCASAKTAELPPTAAQATVLRSLTAAPSEAPRPAPTEDEAEEDFEEDAEEDRILAHCLSILDELPCSVDLDGDGTEEIVDLILLPGKADECLRWAISVIQDGQTKQFVTDILEDMPHDLWVGDLDEDGGYEVFFHGDAASDDYLIYGFRHDLTPLLFEPDDRLVRYDEATVSNVFAGRIEGFEDGHIVIEGVVDMLGTHWGVRNFAIGDDGIIGPVSTVWELDEEIEADRPLTVQRALTAYKARERKDPGEAFTLEAGERIYPVCTDGFSRLWFRTEDGRSGVLLLEADEEHMWLIDGTPEAEYFEFLPYSG